MDGRDCTAVRRQVNVATPEETRLGCTQSAWKAQQTMGRKAHNPNHEGCVGLLALGVGSKQRHYCFFEQDGAPPHLREDIVVFSCASMPSRSSSEATGHSETWSPHTNAMSLRAASRPLDQRMALQLTTTSISVEPSDICA